MSYRGKVVVALALSCTVLLVAAAPSPAPVAPRNCGLITVNAKRYQVKADQIRCRRAKTWSRRYLREHVKPRGYRCKNYGAGTKLKFRCSKGVRVFFAIKR